MKIISLLCILVICYSSVFAQQVADNSFNPEVKNPVYEAGKGPVVFLDEGHNNFHKLEERYQPFKKLLEKDGYILKSSNSKIDKNLLQKCDIFVISDPMLVEDKSPYNKNEIQAMKSWIEEGGSLLLITDHFPDPPAIAGLAAAFGIEVNNSYVLNEAPGEEAGPIFFRRSDNTLTDHPVTRGRKEYDEKINSVTSFTGCAFKAGRDFIPLMIFGDYKKAWMVKEDGKFPPDTPKIDVKGWYQGGVMEVGKGRLGFFAEAGMFTAQIIIGRGIKFGMNSPIAGDGKQFILNIFHWLSKKI